MRHDLFQFKKISLIQEMCCMNTLFIRGLKKSSLKADVVLILLTIVNIIVTLSLE